MSEVFDVAIVGGGLVGASLAVALASTSLRVVLIEAAMPPSLEKAWDERCIAINDASVGIFRDLGLWDRVSSDGEPIVATHVSERGRFGVARFGAGEAGIDALGYNVPLRAIGTALWARLEDSGVAVIRPARVTALHPGEMAMRIVLAPAPADGPDAVPVEVVARLLAAADGAQSAVRRYLGVAAETRDYAQTAIVSAVRLSRPHRGVAYERFTPDGPLALIPKPGDAASLVWTLPTRTVREAMAWSDEEFLHHSEAVFGGRLGRFTELGLRTAYPLTRVVASRTTLPRCVLVGNAAQSLHPVAAQGFNLGLRDVSALGESLRAASAAGDDPGASWRLENFASGREADRVRVSGFTDFLVRTFSNRIPGLEQARHLGIVAADLLPGLRQRVLSQHLGHLDRVHRGPAR